MASPRKYVVTLPEEERTVRQSLLRNGTARARMLPRARLLLLTAEGQTNPFIAAVLQGSPATVTNRGQALCPGRAGGSPVRLSSVGEGPPTGCPGRGHADGPGL